MAILVQEADAPTQQDVSQHYTHGNLVAAIRGGVESLGKTINSMTVDDLAPVDEFHIGGRQASEDFLSQLDLTSEKQVLDVGCGLGGAARFVASHYGCQVTEIDLTPEFVETVKSRLRVGRTGQPRFSASRQCACNAFCRSRLRLCVHAARRHEYRRQSKVVLGGQSGSATELAFRHL